VTFRYGVYGLAIEADAPIDGALPATFDEPDVCVHMQSMPPVCGGGERLFDDENVSIDRDGSSYGFAYRDGTRFLIGVGAPAPGRAAEGGRAHTIRATWPPTSTPEDTATYLLGPILAFVLRMRGTLSLHASAVVVGGRAIAIAAPPGGGKSTTAAAFADRGVAVMTDDVLPVVWRDGSPWALSGYPRVRLWPETVGARYGSDDALPLLTPTWSKRYLDVSARFQRDPLPLGAIVVLRERVAGPARLERIGGAEAAMQLVANSSMALYLDPAMRAAELDGIGALVEQVPLFAAHPSDDLGRLGELCDAITSIA